MHESILLGLQAMRSELLIEWETLLRGKPAPSPLASPDVLVYLMKWTLDEVFKNLVSPPNRRRLRSRSGSPPSDEALTNGCRCGMHPLLTYFACLEEAVEKNLEKVFGLLENLDGVERSAAKVEARLAVTLVSSREIETFCAVCQHAPHHSEKAACQSKTAVQSFPVS